MRSQCHHSRLLLLGLAGVMVTACGGLQQSQRSLAERPFRYMVNVISPQRDLRGIVKRVAIFEPTYSAAEEYKNISLSEDTRWAPFEVVERLLATKILEEQALGMTGAIAPETAAKAGRMLGADHVLLYSADASDDRAVEMVNRHGGQLSGFLTARLVNTETGSVTWSFNGHGVFQTRVPFAPRGAAARSNAVILGRAVFQAALYAAFHEPFLGVLADPGYQGQGAWIFVTFPGTIGAKAGIQYGDVITQVDSQMVTSANDLALVHAQLRKRAYQDSIAVTLTRGSTPITLQVSLDPSK